MSIAPTELARAKINLALHVTGRRADGYHRLDSLVVFAGIGDALSAVAGEGDAIEVAGPFADALAGTAPSANLVAKAVAALRERFPDKVRPTRLRLDKRLPVAGGIGGGSADAAATLRLLNRRFDLSLSRDELAAIGLPLGADVPVCVHSVACRMSGVGEAIAPVAGLPDLPLVLVNPGVGVPTAEAFRRLARPDNPPMPAIPERFVGPREVAAWLASTRNDLADAAKAIAPAVAAAEAAVAAEPECLAARMSGSGATVYGLFPTPGAAEAAAVRIAAAEPGWWVAPTVASGS